MRRSIKDLINALASDNSTARWDAAMFLGDTGDMSAIEPLVKCITDEDYLVRLEAAKALSKLGWTPRNDVEKANYLSAKREWDELVQLGQAAVVPLIRILGDKTWEIRRAAKESMVRIGKPAVKSLILALGDGDENVRQCAADALGDINDIRAVEPLIRALEDVNKLVRHAAAVSLGQLRDDRAIAPLINTLEDRERYVVEGTCWAFRKIGDAAVAPLVKALIEGKAPAVDALVMIGEPAVKPLIRLLKHKEAGPLAAAALGMMGNRQAIRPLTAALRRQDEELQKAAQRALDAIRKGIRYDPVD